MISTLQTQQQEDIYPIHTQQITAPPAYGDVTMSAPGNPPPGFPGRFPGRFPGGFPRVVPGSVAGNNVTGLHTVVPSINVSTTRNYANSDDDEDDLAGISIFVDTPFYIRGDGNMVAFDPSENAKRITAAVVDALKQLAGGDGCVPMVDNEGQPRAVKLSVKSDMRVEGSRNIVGERAAMGQAVNAGKKMAADMIEKARTAKLQEETEMQEQKEGKDGKENDYKKRAREDENDDDSKRTRLN